MARLDFAMIAEYARVDSAGLITVVAGGFDRVAVHGKGAVQQMHVALRILHEEGETVPFEVKVLTPDGSDVAVAGVVGEPPPGASPTDGLFNFTAALGLGVPVRSPGRYVVQIILAGEVVRELPFVVTLAAQG
jgi:hypothetical protein